MKHILLFVLLSLGSVLHSQKHDYQWILGYDGYNSLIDFRSVPPSVSFNNYRMSTWGISSTISDSMGNLLFYSNASDVWDRMRNRMLNGDSLCFDTFNSGSPFGQTMLILSDYIDERKFHFLQLYANLNTSNFESPIYNRLNMNLQNGFGDIQFKSKLNLIDSFSMSILATRHANGRDWWAIYPSLKSNRYFIYLVTENGPTLAHIDTLSIPWSLNNSYLGWSCAMSPRGDRILVQDWRPNLGVMDIRFDRCQGRLTFQNNTVLEQGVTCAISPNGDVAYYVSRQHIIQLDLKRNEYWLYPDTVAVYDSSHVTPIPAFFNMLQNTPDGRLFVSTTSSQRFLHVIERPNQLGRNCNVRQRIFQLPAFNFNSIPNYPNYRLGALDGSPCDTLGLDAPPFLTWAQQVQTVTEGNTQVSLRMRLDRPSADTIRTSVRYVPSYGSATVGQDLDAFPDVPVTLLPGDTSATVYVQLLDDNLPERPDTAVFAIVHPTHAVAPSWYCYLDILDNDPSGMASTPWAEDILLYPNPAMDYLTIDARGSNIEGGRYALIDALGRILRTGDLHSQKQWLDLRDLPSGLYFLELRALLSEGNEGVKRMKVLKQ